MAVTTILVMRSVICIDVCSCYFVPALDPRLTLTSTSVTERVQRRAARFPTASKVTVNNFRVRFSTNAKI